MVIGHIQTVSDTVIGHIQTVSDMVIGHIQTVSDTAFYYFGILWRSVSYKVRQA